MINDWRWPEAGFADVSTKKPFLTIFKLTVSEGSEPFILRLFKKSF